MANKNLNLKDKVKAKKWNGEEFIGILEYEYKDGSYCVSDKNGRRFNIKHNDIKPHSENLKEELKILTEKIGED